MNCVCSDAISKSNFLMPDSQQLVKMSNTKYSRDENNKISKFRTLDDANPEDMKIKSKHVTHYISQIKRSKTPSTNYTSLKIKNSSFKNWNPKNYYANISGSGRETGYREEKSFSNFQNNKNNENSESKAIYSKKSYSKYSGDQSTPAFPKPSDYSSISHIQNMLEIKLMSKKNRKYCTLFKIKGKQLDCCINKSEKQNNRKFSTQSVESSDKVGDIVFMRDDKHFIIKVKNVREINKDFKCMSITFSKEYNDKIKNTIVMSIKQGMKLLIDNQNNYSKVCDRLYYKYGRLMLS